MQDYTNLTIEQCITKLALEDDFDVDHLAVASQSNSLLAFAIILQSQENNYLERFNLVHTQMPNLIYEKLVIDKSLFQELLNQNNYAEAFFNHSATLVRLLQTISSLTDVLFDRILLQNSFYRKLLFKNWRYLFYTAKKPELLQPIFNSEPYLSELLDALDTNNEFTKLEKFTEIAFFAARLGQGCATILYCNQQFRASAFMISLRILLACYPALTNNFQKHYSDPPIKAEEREILKKLALKQKVIAREIFTTNLWCFLNLNPSSKNLCEVFTKWPDLISQAMKILDLFYVIRDNKYYNDIIKLLIEQKKLRHLGSIEVLSTLPVYMVYVIKPLPDGNTSFDPNCADTWCIASNSSIVLTTENDINNVTNILNIYKNANIKVHIFGCFAAGKYLGDLFPVKISQLELEGQVVSIRHFFRDRKKLIPLKFTIQKEDIIAKIVDPNDKSSYEPNPYVNGHIFQNPDGSPKKRKIG